MVLSCRRLQAKFYYLAFKQQINYMKKLTKKEIEDFNFKVKSRGLRGVALIEYKTHLSLTAEQKEIIVGTLLGDASIRASNSAYNIKFEQKYTQVDYLLHLYEIFEPFVGTGPKMRIIHNSFHKDYGVSCWFRTYSHICLTYYANMFYAFDENRKRKKIVPKNIHKLLTPRALAYWFMDDGSSFKLKKVNSSSATGGDFSYYTLNTQSFTLIEQKILIKALKRNFNLDFTVVKDKKYYRIQTNLASADKFYKIISYYVINSFEYKLKRKRVRK
jgi:hypothetical protein